MKGKGILDRKGMDKTVRKQERKKATFYCSFASLNRRYLVEVSIRNLFFLCDCETPVLATRTLFFSSKIYNTFPLYLSCAVTLYKVI